MSHTSLIPGSTSGTAVPAGYIGETITSNPSSATDVNSAAADTWVDASAIGTITVPAGTWLIGYNVTTTVVNVNGATNSPQGNVRLYNVTAGSAVAKSNALVGCIFVGTAYTHLPASRMVPVVLTAPATFRLDVRCNLAVTVSAIQIRGYSFTGTLTDPDNESTLFAVRIA